MGSRENGPALGILGGSFDPPHLGHLILARDALEQFGLDRVLLVPAVQSPLRDAPHVASFEQRLGLLRKVAAGRPWLEVLDVEGGLPQPSYTVQTARALRGLYPGARLIWLIGADHLARLPLWKDPVDLARLVEFGVAARPGFPPVAPAVEGVRAQFLQPRNVEISSTELRQRLAQGLPIDHLVPFEIVETLQSQGNYLRTLA